VDEEIAFASDVLCEPELKSKALETGDKGVVVVWLFSPRNIGDADDRGKG